MRKILLSTFFSFLLTVSFTQVTQINADNYLLPAAKLNNTLSIFRSYPDSSLWVSDGTLAGTIQISDTIKCVSYGGVVVNGTFIFKGFTPHCGLEICATDGTKSGTKIVKDINPGLASSQQRFTDMAAIDGYIYFTAVTPGEGCELWRSDGTALNTSIVKDIVPGTGSGIDSSHFTLSAFKNKLLFSAQTDAYGNEVWSTDGTAANTFMLFDIVAGNKSSNPGGFYYLDNMALFTVSQEPGYKALWRTDGTTAGTVLLKDSVESTFDGYLHVFKNRAYFLLSHFSPDEYGYYSLKAALWGTDGIDSTSVHTTFISDLDLYNGLGNVESSHLADAINLPDKFIFPYADDFSLNELWESDGSSAGTRLFKYLPPDPTISVPYIYTNQVYDPVNETTTYPLLNGSFYIVIQDEENGKELWKSDQATDNTDILMDINPGSASGIEDQSYIYTNTELFFSANDGVNGNELWQTDGTNTAMVKDISPGSGSSNPGNFFLNNKLFFSAGAALYVLDGNLTILPVKLLDFTVTPKSDDALLKWSTSSEINSQDFTIQSSDNTIKWNTIGKVAAAGNSSLQQDYSYTDVGIMNSGKSIVYYRLLQNDIDGKTTTSNVIQLKLNGKEQWDVKLLSNPVADQLKLKLIGLEKNAEFYINDMAGRLVYERQLQNQNGILIIPVSLKAGVYILTVKTANENKTIKFVKE